MQREPIFIQGIMHRSGTVWLYDLLNFHPDCKGSPPLWENQLLLGADKLAAYVDIVSSHWDPEWGVEGDALYQALGNGLLLFLSSRIGKKRLLTKAPFVDNISYFFRLFPSAYLLIIVRDGRAVVESAVRTFGWDYEVTMHRWAKAAHTILRFDQEFKDAGYKYLIVRYEDLYCNLVEELSRILDFLNLDTGCYDFNAAAESPVRGSSELVTQRTGTVHWKAMSKPAGFNPLQRWQHWDRALHERFNWIAGEYLASFGYQKQEFDNKQLYFTLWNIAKDTRRLTRKALNWMATRASCFWPEAVLRSR